MVKETCQCTVKQMDHRIVNHSQHEKMVDRLAVRRGQRGESGRREAEWREMEKEADAHRRC